MHFEKQPLLKSDKGDFLPESGYGNDLMRSYYTTDGRILKYDPWRVVSLASVARIGGTVFASRVPWFWALCYCLVWAFTFFVFRVCLPPFYPSHSASGFEDFVDDIAVFMGVLLALHTMLALRRWLALRHEVIGSLWAAVNDIALLLAVQLPATADRSLKTLVLRYGLASVELLLASEVSELEACSNLQRRGLLTADECEKLSALPARPKVLWVWMAAVFQRLAWRGLLPSTALERIYELCNRGRLACDRAGAYGHSQLPMVYTHLLVVLAHLACAMVAVRNGIIAAALAWEMSGEKASRTGGLVNITAQLLLAAAVPICYSALLQYAATISDPLCPESILGMPFSAYHVFMRDECESFHTAGENVPKAVTRALDQLDEDPEALPWEDLVVVANMPATGLNLKP